ncbi:iron ABC transporter substrate-binding protein [Aerococcus urinaehominis]|uniref:Iron ABC transporter substrate-binding protein n=1 Tax=Aerococcus urinaehominis TaxID=128944 RepID=A0A0X8FK09_9LACT|nr:siderophore ABC transporter substrate-binding protein [Aerococcus urinaehominis]AMB98667.1 iron ABC transporter substrate-binding protein [Aerococcus urinaehominis]SDL97860.1 iron complex transport system substrate-binding protein [Aerococcus urinaehominis]
MHKFTKYSLVLSAGLVLAACGQSKPQDSEKAAESNVSQAASQTSNDQQVDQATVTVKDIHGEVQVPVQPKKVVALDNRTFETLEDWGVDLVAVPKDVMPADSAYVKDDKVENIGNHREPNLELIAAADPDLVIVGQRFAKYYDDIKALAPNAAIVDYSWNTEDAENTGQSLMEGFKTSTQGLGAIFQKEDQAQALIDNLDKAIADVKSAYNGQDKVMSVIVSGGEIGYAAPHTGRVWGPLYDLFNLKPALEVADSSSDHQGDDISVEAIAQSNPDWLLVLDRDAAITDTESQPAQEVIEDSPALKSLDAVKNNHVIYAPADTYTNESIQTLTEIFQSMAKAFKGE